MRRQPTARVVSPADVSNPLQTHAQGLPVLTFYRMHEPEALTSGKD